MKKEELFFEEEIKERKKLSPEVKDSIITLTFFNIIIATIMLVTSLIINISFNKLELSSFNNYIKFVQIALAIITIVIFEVGYRKDSLKIGVYGIEFSIFSVSVLYVSYMYATTGNIYYLKNIALLFSFYYVVKSCIMMIIYRNNYIKNNISDVKEIVKDDKIGYLDEESEKTLKKQMNLKNNKNSK